ncbi:NEL-type E3 ubiquitin ligase domain-containing protein [Pseudomonas sp. NBRC 111124]|uniref:NEL-type E3 ubiquitin ligase domain-containing protein n=1 Tax=Pseudomonas sp. NBRC 111124 TaxID=1661039 RepID=UPI0007610BA8|nr:NEL-type E3 ubiquitin ligase domain-containing protein [Pseudomonas sp. NBRC 111124]
MSNHLAFPPGSVDQLLAQRLPAWLTAGSANRLQAYNRALATQQMLAQRMKSLFQAIPSLDEFAAPRLEKALLDAGLSDINVRAMKVVLTEDVQLPSAAEKLYKPIVRYTSRQSLLAAALHNFEEKEARPWLLRKAHLEDANGKPLALSFERFVLLCRQLDIGAQYQVQLRSVLQPKSRPEGRARQAVEQLFQDSLRARMEIAVHEAAIKEQLDDPTYNALLALFTTASDKTRATTTLVKSQLYLLGKCIVGAVAVEIRSLTDDRLQSVVVWLPDDPEQLIHRHDSWQQLYENLAVRLCRPSYRTYFSRFIKADDRVAFDQALASALLRASPGEAVGLDGRNFPTAEAIFSHVRELSIDKIFADARYLAVPTGDEDLRSRHARLQGMLSAGLDLLGWAGLFVPVLGELMLVVCAAQLLDDAYEGYQDWRLGDREDALNHLFAVAQTLALGAFTAGAAHTLKRFPFVDGLVPKITQGELKLARELQLAHIENSPGSLLEALDNEHFNGVLNKDAHALLATTGLNLDQVRRLRVENANAPAKLLDQYDRFVTCTEFPDLRGDALDAEVAQRQPQPSEDQARLISAFSGLTPRAAKEIIEQSSSVQRDSLQASARIPLGMAEKARWYLRDSRLDKACVGLRLPQAINADTERLVMALVDKHSAWPSSTRMELRVGNREGRLLYASDAEGASPARVIVRSRQGYWLSETPADTLAEQDESLFTVLLRCLSEEQKTAMAGGARMTSAQLQEWMMQAACREREQLAGMLGLKPLAEGMRPPRHFADGRLGYALSGGGESSQQAIRRGIQQIFSTMSDLQLDAYLQAVRERGVNLWDHYQTLQQQLGALRQALHEWQSAWRSPADAIRRRRVADTLRRSWRRKLVDVNDTYELVLDGERIDALPTLPEGVNFAHVRRLVLRDMNLDEVPEDFLRRFPNVVEIDLSGNRLTSVPAGIEQLVQLRRLNLSRNRLTIDAEGNQRLAQLALLDSCELSFNPLMQAPDLSGLRHVRHLHLRASGQVDIPQLLERASWRAVVDLRDNRIWQLQQEVHGLTQRLSRFELHDNPLDGPSQQHLERARDSSVRGARGRPSHRHAEVTTQIRDAWVQSSDAQLRTRRELTWDRLRDEPGSSDLFRFLADFVKSEDFGEHPGHFRRRIWRILDACEQSEVLREQIFAEARQSLTCEDRSLLMLGQMEVGVLVQRGIADVPAERMETRLLHLGRQLHRLDLVDSIATRYIQQMRSSGLRLVDEVEIRLYYRNQLAQALELPVPVDDMHYASYANVTQGDLQRAQMQVLQDDTQMAVLDSLAQRPFWQRFVRQRYPERFEALAAPFHERLAESERLAEGGQEQSYVVRSNELMQELELAEQQLYRSLALEAWQRADH